MPLLLRAALPGDVGCVYVRSGAMDTGSLMGTRALRDPTEGSLLTIACVSACPKIYYSGSSFFQRPQIMSCFLNLIQPSFEYVHSNYIVLFITYRILLFIKHWLLFTKYLLCARHCAECLMFIKNCIRHLLWIVLCNPHSKPLK